MNGKSPKNKKQAEAEEYYGTINITCDSKIVESSIRLAYGHGFIMGKRRDHLDYHYPVFIMQKRLQENRNCNGHQSIHFRYGWKPLS